ncbi:hypothetical protein B0H11DRAFT_2262047 [Mycena galericulata]|nr:hypothetical protein B0H11DRAFT_2262047 [Mycena galericulata]
MGRPIFEAREHSLGAFRALPASEGRGRVELDVPFMRVRLLSPDAATRFYDTEPMSPLSAESLCFPILGALPSDDIDNALAVSSLSNSPFERDLRGFLISTFHTLLIHRLAPPARRMPLPAAAVRVYPYALPAAAEPVSASTSASAAPGARRLTRRRSPLEPTRGPSAHAALNPSLRPQTHTYPARDAQAPFVRSRPFWGIAPRAHQPRYSLISVSGSARTDAPPAAAPSSGYGQPADDPATGTEPRLTALLCLTRPPTRSALFASALSPGALALAPPPPPPPPAITRLYQVLEGTFDALSLCAEIAPVMRELKAEGDYALDVPLLERVVLSHLLSQLAQVYASFRIDFVTELVKPLRELAVEVPAAAAAPVAAGEEKPETETPTPSSSQAQEEKPKALVAILNTEHEALQLRCALVARMREPLSELSEEARRKELQRIQRIQEDMKAQGTERYKVALVEKGILKLGDHQKIAALDAEGLIGIQVAQLEKEKKELTERLRIVAKHVAHIEPVYRKVEQPLLAHDYEQQAADPATFAAIGAARQEAACGVRLQDLETKARLARMLLEYEKRRAVVLAKKGEEYAKHKDAAAQKIEEEKTKRRMESGLS